MSSITIFCTAFLVEDIVVGSFCYSPWFTRTGEWLSWEVSIRIHSSFSEHRLSDEGLPGDPLDPFWTGSGPTSTDLGRSSDHRDRQMVIFDAFILGVESGVWSITLGYVLLPQPAQRRLGLGVMLMLLLLLLVVTPSAQLEVWVSHHAAWWGLWRRQGLASRRTSHDISQRCGRRCCCCRPLWQFQLLFLTLFLQHPDRQMVQQCCSLGGQFVGIQHGDGSGRTRIETQVLVMLVAGKRVSVALFPCCRRTCICGAWDRAQVRCVEDPASNGGAKSRRRREGLLENIGIWIRSSGVSRYIGGIVLLFI